MSMARECLKDPVTRSHVLNQLGVIIRKEIKSMASDTTGSILRSQCVDDVKSFTWRKVTNELAIYAPTLLQILKAVTDTKTERRNRDATIAVCASVLLKYRYQNMSFVQKIVSLILYTGHSSKQVCTVQIINENILLFCTP